MENKDVYFNYLEQLRKSGVTNMFGATPYLEANFEELTHAEAVSILKEWMKNYKELSDRLGWDKSDDVVLDSEEKQEIEIPGEEYSRLFDSSIDRDIIDGFLKSMADQETMSELDNAKHIWTSDEENRPFIIEYNDGDAKIVSVVDGKVTVYGKMLDEYCSDFGLNFEELHQEILDETGIDFKPEEEPFEDDSEEVYDYGTDAVIADEEEVIPEEEIK